MPWWVILLRVWAVLPVWMQSCSSQPCLGPCVEAGLVGLLPSVAGSAWATWVTLQVPMNWIPSCLWILIGCVMEFVLSTLDKLYQVPSVWKNEERKGKGTRVYVWPCHGFCTDQILLRIWVRDNHRIEFHWISVTETESIIKESSEYFSESGYIHFGELLRRLLNFHSRLEFLWAC